LNIEDYYLQIIIKPRNTPKALMMEISNNSQLYCIRLLNNLYRRAGLGLYYSVHDSWSEPWSSQWAWGFEASL